MRVYLYRISNQQIKSIVLNKESRGFHEFLEKKKKKDDVREGSFIFAGSLVSFPAITIWRHPGKLIQVRYCHSSLLWWWDLYIYTNPTIPMS